MRTYLSVVFTLLTVLSANACNQTRAVEGESIVQGPVAERVDAYLDRAASFGFSGAVLVAVEGEIVLNKGYGLADYDRGTPFTTETAFDMGSITKSLTATAILSAEADGLLSVNDSIGRFFENVPADKAGITIHHLLTHSSGLQNSVGDDYDATPRDSFIGLALGSDLLWRPGTRYWYSNAGYGLLAAVVEVASGKSYEGYLREHIFEPAGMHTTGYVGVNWDTTRVAHSYRRGVDEGTPFSGRMAIWERVWSSDGPYWNLLGNGGLVTTTADLYRFVRALDDGILVPESQRAKLSTPFVPENPEGSSHYGYGWTFFPNPRGGQLIAHDGSDGAFYSLVRRYVDDGVVLVFHANASGLTTVVRRIDALLWGEPVDGLPASSASVEATFLDSIVGTYALASGGHFDVRRQEEGLVVRAADRSVATLFVGTPIPPSDDRLRDLRSNAPMIVEAMGQGDFAPYRSVYQSDGPDFGGEVSFWMEAFESWGERFGAIKAVRLLGGGELGGRLVGIVVIEYESNIRFVRFERQADGRYFIFVDGGAWLTTRRRFLPVEADEFVAYDFLLGTACRMHVVRSAEGHVSGLRVGCPTEEEGGVVARKLASR